MRRLAAVLTPLAMVVAAAGCATSSAPGAAGTAALGTHPAAAHAGRAHAHRSAKRIRHVFVIVLENKSYAAAYRHNPNHYLGKRLQAKGTLLTHYYATGHYSLDNYIAMISGQAPNDDTTKDCSRYNNLNGTTKPAQIDANGQAVGTGCVYPRNVKTLADQLAAHHISWRGYMDDMGAVRGREQRRCGVPTLDSTGHDPTNRATPRDQYAAKHNPFVFFHSLVDSGLCHKHVVSLGHLTKALRHVSTTPRFSFITPDLCDDGHDSPCVGTDSMGSNAGGLVSIDHFLRTWVPPIMHSAAFKRSGLLIITSDESDGGDASSCCGEQPGPSDPTPGITGPGGGRIGTLLLGPCVRRGATDARRYNHYALLRSLEDIFKIRDGGTDGHGHLGFAAASGLRPLGKDALGRCAP